MDPKPIYLDYQATTPVDPKVREAMQPFLKDEFGNRTRSITPTDGQRPMRSKSRRAQLALFINADDNEIVFTSGATESCNLALRGVLGLPMESATGSSRLPPSIQRFSKRSKIWGNQAMKS